MSKTAKQCRAAMLTAAALALAVLAPTAASARGFAGFHGGHFGGAAFHPGRHVLRPVGGGFGPHLRVFRPDRFHGRHLATKKFPIPPCEANPNHGCRINDCRHQPYASRCRRPYPGLTRFGRWPTYRPSGTIYHDPGGVTTWKNWWDCTPGVSSIPDGCQLRAGDPPTGSAVWACVEAPRASITPWICRRRLPSSVSYPRF